jgi:hypothetical protein
MIMEQLQRKRSRFILKIEERRKSYSQDGCPLDIEANRSQSSGANQSVANLSTPVTIQIFLVFD